jgi:hypothetical protein
MTMIVMGELTTSSLQELTLGDIFRKFLGKCRVIIP